MKLATTHGNVAEISALGERLDGFTVSDFSVVGSEYGDLGDDACALYVKVIGIFTAAEDVIVHYGNTGRL